LIVTLPEAAAAHIEAAQAKKKEPQLLAAGAECQILIVDDNEDAAELLAALLRKHGHNVVIANDPVKALEAVRANIPDVAFLDIGLPVMDGYELAAHLRTELGQRCPKLIAVTGYGQQKDRERSRLARFALHLVKPVQQTSVLDALKQVVHSEN
jgi:CheY-like chemotaxis protein